VSENASTWRQSFHLLCDHLLGYGMSRSVYSSKLMPDCVVKVEDGSGQFQNIIEWETWQRVKHTDMAKWFAECRWISPNGTILIMERTRPPAKGEFLDKMPVFLCDFKRTNYGMVGPGKGKDRLVCHDYGTNLMFENGMTKRMHKADWWDA